MKKNQSQLIIGLDIGSSAIRLAAGTVTEPTRADATNVEVRLLAAAESPSAGVHRGVVSSLEDLVSSISAASEKLERVLGQPVDRVWAGVSGTHIISQPSKGVIAVSKADNEITEEDVHRVLEAARMISVPLNYEVLHVLPKSFGVDGQSGIKDPVGMTGLRLEAEAQIILGAVAQNKNLAKAIYRSGLEIENLVLSIIASAESVATSRQRELGVAVINLGSATTSLAVYEEGEVLHTAILPVGSEHITNDIAIGLRTSIEVAEKVKVSYGNNNLISSARHDEIDLAEFGAGSGETVKSRYLSEIVDARLEEIMRKIDQELIKIKRSGLLPAGVIFIGGGAKLWGIIEAARTHLRLPATVGYPLGLVSVSDKINDPAFAAAISLVEWGGKMNNEMSFNLSRGVKDAGGAVLSKLKNWAGSLLP